MIVFESKTSKNNLKLTVLIFKKFLSYKLIPPVLIKK